MTMSDERLEAFLREPNVGVLSTVDAGGRPHQAPIWFLWEDGAAYMFTGRGSLKWRNILGNAEASLCIDTKQPPYRSAIIEGTCAEDGRPLDELIRRLAIAYYGEQKGREFADEGDYSDRERSVAIKLTPRRVLSWDYETEG